MEHLPQFALCFNQQEIEGFFVDGGDRIAVKKESCNLPTCGHDPQSTGIYSWVRVERSLPDKYLMSNDGVYPVNKSTYRTGGCVKCPDSCPHGCEHTISNILNISNIFRHCCGTHDYRICSVVERRNSSRGLLYIMFKCGCVIVIDKSIPACLWRPFCVLSMLMRSNAAVGRDQSRLGRRLNGPLIRQRARGRGRGTRGQRGRFSPYQTRSSLRNADTGSLPRITDDIHHSGTQSVCSPEREEATNSDWFYSPCSPIPVHDRDVVGSSVQSQQTESGQRLESGQCALPAAAALLSGLGRLTDSSSRAQGQPVGAGD